MDLLTRFGNIYTFPNSQINLSTTFGELVTRTRRLPGVDGGFDDLGDGRGLSEIGKVKSDFWLFFDNRADASAKTDSIKRIADAGVQRLFMQPIDRNMPERWCFARLNNINIPQAAKDQPHKRAQVSLTFQASDPFWYGQGNSAVWAGGARYGDGTRWSGNVATVVSGVNTILTLNNSGSAYTYVQVAIRPTLGQSCSDPILRRIVDGDIIDEVTYVGTLNALDNLSIDSRRASVRLNHVSAYTSQFHTKTLHFLRLMPGSNTIQIRFGQSTDTANVCIRWLERYT